MHLVGVNATEIGALKVMEFLKKQLEDHNIYYGRYFTDKALREEAMGSSTAANFLHSCKMSCYVAQDYEAELSSKDSKLILVLPDDSNITLSVECFRTGEVLFRPYLARILHRFGRSTERKGSSPRVIIRLVKVTSPDFYDIFSSFPRLPGDFVR
ncbi:actin-related protein 8-like isoform X2 [Solanum lycopersicum]